MLGAFDGRHVRHHGIASKFFRGDGAYWVETDGPDGKLQACPVAYVFGVYPLQQYLLALPGGRLQAFSIAWDSRPATSGGQRWFHLHGSSDCTSQGTADDCSMVDGEAAPSTAPKTPVVERGHAPAQVYARDPMHWTGSYYNWNSRCAECHSTNLSKRYDPNSGTYATTWSEINVGCEACHGPGERHMALADAGQLKDAPNAGLNVDLGAAGAWRFVANETIAQRSPPADKPRQAEICARCHARRTSLSEDRHGADLFVDLLDTHLPALLEEGLYYVDGQIRDEVYVYGSFVQSKMHQAGVTCSNCHEPHGLALRAPGNAVCAQCHLPAAYDNTAHHHHAASSPGAACVNCHMPATTYMSVDPRRDHSLRIPRPDLSAIVGTPNACNGCHQERSFAWATDALEKWGIRFGDAESHPARVLHGARQGDARAAHALRAIAMDDGTPAIWRATAAAELARFPSRQVVESAAFLLTSDDAMLRLGAVRAIEFLPWPQRLQMLEPHFRDPATAIRMELARVLADVPEARVAVALAALFDEYLQSLARHADMPESLSQQGDFLAARRQYARAEKAYRQALESDPQHVPTLLNLADLYRVLERDNEARTVLGTAIASAPAQAAPHHALRLLETRAGNREVALRHLERAAALETEGIRYRYVYAIALYDTGDARAALKVLRSLLDAAPGNPDVLLALVNYSRNADRIEDARRYANELRKLFPDDPAIRHLYDSL